MGARFKRSNRTSGDWPVTYPWLALERAKRFLERGAALEPQIGKEGVRRECEDCLAAAIVFGDSALEQLQVQVGRNLKKGLGHRLPLVDFMTRVRNSEMHFTVVHFQATLNAQAPMHVPVAVKGIDTAAKTRVRQLWAMGPEGATDERDWLRIQPNRLDRQIACFAQQRSKQWEAFTGAHAVRVIFAYLRVIERENARHDLRFRS